MTDEELASRMKLGMRRLASGVCVLSTCVNEHDRFAMTVSSVTAVTDAPPSLLVCVNKQISLRDHLEHEGCRFAINVLSAEQQDISHICAGVARSSDRFSVGNWATKTGYPYLTDAEASFFCQTDKVMSYGTHFIIVANITSVTIASEVVDPLIYLNGRYGSFS